MARLPFFKKALACALIAALLLPACALAQSAVVNNGSDPKSLLHLRAKPAKDAMSLGKFYTGTPVDIVGDAGGGFVQVTIGTSEPLLAGYMMASFLTDAAAAQNVQDATCGMDVVSPYGTPSVVLRSTPSDSYDALAMLAVGDTVQRIGIAGDFYYVMLADGLVGCLAADELE